MPTVFHPAGIWNLTFKASLPPPPPQKSFPQPSPHHFSSMKLLLFLLVSLHVYPSYPVPIHSVAILHQIIFNKIPFSHLFLFGSSCYHSTWNSFCSLTLCFCNIFPKLFPCLYIHFLLGSCCEINSCKSLLEHLLLLMSPSTPSPSFLSVHTTWGWFFFLAYTSSIMNI